MKIKELVSLYGADSEAEIYIATDSQGAMILKSTRVFTGNVESAMESKYGIVEPAPKSQQVVVLSPFSE